MAETPETSLSPAVDLFTRTLVLAGDSLGNLYVDVIAANDATNPDRNAANRALIMAGVLMIARACEWCPDPDDAQQDVIEEFPELLKEACRLVELPEWRAQVGRREARPEQADDESNLIYVETFQQFPIFKDGSGYLWKHGVIEEGSFATIEDARADIVGFNAEGRS